MSDHSTKVHPHHRRWGIIILLIVLALSAWGIISRLHDDSSLKKRTDDQAIPTVSVMQVVKGPLNEELVLPGNVQAWHEAPIYARINGYIKDWKTDIGSRVKAGDLLAEIETPEVEAQTQQAEADLNTAEANNQLAQTTAKRWLELLKTNSVSKQEADEKTGAAAADEALVVAAKANLDRLKQTEDFKHVVAPFDGIISARNIDTGSLINAGSSGTGPELFHIVETDKLRVYVQVPEYDASYIKPDLVAELHFAEYPQKTFNATLERTADAIDPTSRTLLIQLVIDNASGELMPGSYAEVHIKLPQSGDAVHLPVNTFLFRSEGMQVAVVDSNGKAQLKTLTIGRDYGKEVEVTSGVAPGDTVILNPPDSLESGQKVKIAAPRNKDSKNKDGAGKDSTNKDDQNKDGQSKDDKKP